MVWYTLSTTKILWYVLKWTIGGQKKEINLFCKDCVHGKNKYFCVAIQIFISYQKISLEYNNFNHDNNNNFLLEGDGHYKDRVVKIVVVQKSNR